jgi:hypothetical protein
MNEEHDYEYTMHMTIENVRLMSYCVEQAIKYWPGAPARPLEEQQQLDHMKRQFQRMLLDHQFHNS